MPVPQENLSFVERASCPFLRMVQNVSFNTYVAPFSSSLLGTGKMPVPQENLSFVERASCPFLRMVQNVSYRAKLIFFRIQDFLSFD
ncbi:hypothetical protein [Microcoleus sp. K1-B6]|uniref:hypothetical protein n=1 Tax=Microcoleus sp. K1-B6 TaxID=2818787 RepID=UPI002FD82465